LGAVELFSFTFFVLMASHFLGRCSTTGTIHT
jgi:hypothetical protein